MGVISDEVYEVFCEQLCTIGSCYDQEKGALWMLFQVPGLVGSLDGASSSLALVSTVWGVMTPWMEK